MNWQVWVFIILFSMLPIGVFYMVFKSIRDLFKVKKKTRLARRIEAGEDERRLADAHRFNANASELDES